MHLDITNWKTPAEIIANVIANSISTLVLGTNLFVGYLPDLPADCVAIIDTGGGEQDSLNKIDEVSIQIYSRNTSYQTGYNIQNLIKTELQSLALTNVGDEKIIGVWVRSNIAFLKKDESDKSLFSSNYRVMINTNKNKNRI